MKHPLLIFFFFATLTIISCRKELQPTDAGYIETVRQGLTDSLQAADFAALDFSRAARSRIDGIGLFFLRIPFRQKNGQEDFVFVKTDEKGKIERGKIVHLNGAISDQEIGGATIKSWNGSISLASLDRSTVFQAPIQNGYITAFHQQNRYRTGSHEAEGKVMPEVIISYTIPSSREGASWTPWFMLQMLSGGSSGGGSAGGYYSDFSGSEGPTGGGGRWLQRW
jgi:hypothetical protein